VLGLLGEVVPVLAVLRVPVVRALLVPVVLAVLRVPVVRAVLQVPVTQAVLWVPVVRAVLRACVPAVSVQLLLLLTLVALRVISHRTSCRSRHSQDCSGRLAWTPGEFRVWKLVLEVKLGLAPATAVPTGTSTRSQ